jgi:hypothetical protein
MKKSRIDAIALFAAMIAAGLAALQVPEPLAWIGSLAGIVLLLTIFAYDQEGYRSLFESLAFSAVCGFCVLVAAATGFRAWIGRAQLLGPNVRLAIDPLTGDWLPLTWACLTALIWAIDRIRMNSRQAVYADAAQPVKRSGSTFNIAGEASAPRPIENAPQVAPASPPEPVPTPFPITPAAAPEPVAQPIPAGAVPVRPLKEVMVYVNLMGEGLNVMRSVRAEHLGRNFYRIVEAMPAEETWEYGPGQVVRCEKRKLSTGKALVAIEEAPRQA